MPIVGGASSTITVEIQGKIDDITSKVDALDKSFDQFTAKTNEANAASAKAAQTAKMSWTDFRSMYSTVLDVVRLGVQVWDATGQKFVDNAIAVGDMARALGVSTEEASRLKKMGDDVGMTLESMTTAMKLAQKNGIEPDIKGIAALSDKYLALNPGVERSQFLLDNFGRSGMEMGKLLDKGSASILALAAATDKNLLVTAKAYEEAQRYKIATNELGDSWNALVYKSAPPLVEAVTAITNAMRDDISAMDAARDAGYTFHTASTLGYVAALKQAAAEREKTDALKLSTAAQGDATDAATIAVEREKDLAAALKATEEANASLITGAIGVQKAYDDEVSKQQDVQTKLDALYAEKDKLYAWDKKGIDEINAKIDEQKKVYADNAAAFVAAMKTKWATNALDLIEMSDGVKGFTDGELKKAEAIAKTTGLATDGAFQQQLAMTILNQAVINGKVPVEDYGKIMDQVMADGVVSVQEVTDAINNIPNKKSILLDVVIKYIPKPGGGVKPYASGGSFVIPSEYGNEGFGMGGMATASAGEKVTITPQGSGGSSGGSSDSAIMNMLAVTLQALPGAVARAVRQNQKYMR